MRNTLHVISHTHWDREWYMPFEKHRLRLVALMDMLLDIFDKEPAFRHFHMDGQMIPYEDYLAVRPGKLDDLQSAIAGGKLSLGPWYVLQDEALTSGEANVRNMMYGLKLARRFGEPLMVGYLPDTFGHFSQMPQILRGFGIDCAVMGRGVNRYDAEKAKNPDADPGEVGYKSEFTWRSPDGSEILTAFMANWYSNAMDIPADPDEAAQFLSRSRDNALAFATTSELLLMNGCDHTPTRPDVGRVIESVRGRMPDTIIHTTLADYFEALRPAVGDLQVAEGELRSEYTDGWTTLADTLSARMYEKQANYRCQQLLERWTEPLAAIAAAMGDRHASDEIWYAWATLMKNHPHDSICGCSCDEVHREIDIRFEKAEQTAATLRDEAAQAIGNRVDSSFVSDDAATVLVFNPLTDPRNDVVEFQVQFPAGTEVADIEVTDTDGNRLSAMARASEPNWAYQLPDDRFRTPYDCTRMECLVALPDVPGMGYKALSVRPLAEPAQVRPPRETTVLENEFLRVDLHRYGLLDITEKASGITFTDLNIYEDGGDCGDEYIYRAPRQDKIIRTDDPEGLAALDPDPLLEDTCDLPEAFEHGLGSMACVSSCLSVPASSSADGRDELSGPMVLSTEFFLARDARHLQVRLQMDNHAGDHRLRALFPSEIKAEECFADAQFDITPRRIVPWEGWKNPSNPQPMQAFVDISDGEKGLCIAGRGLPSYEILRDGRNTIALTLLRSVGRLGDWGAFPTPEAQCQGTQKADYAIIPHAGHIMDPLNCDAARLAWNYATPLWASQIKHPMYPHPERWTSALPPTAAFVTVAPQWLVLSAIKKAEGRDSLIARIYNPFDADTDARFGCLWPISEAWETDLGEERLASLPVTGDGVTIEAPAKRIVTVELVL